MFVYVDATIRESYATGCALVAVSTREGPVAFTVHKSLVTKHGVQCVRVGEPTDGIVLVHIPAAPPWQAPLALYVRESELTVVEVST